MNNPGGLPTIEFLFDYPVISYARIEEWLTTAWYASVNPRYSAGFYDGRIDKARTHNYES